MHSRCLASPFPRLLNTRSIANTDYIDANVLTMSNMFIAQVQHQASTSVGVSSMESNKYSLAHRHAALNTATHRSPY